MNYESFYQILIVDERVVGVAQYETFDLYYYVLKRTVRVYDIRS